MANSKDWPAMFKCPACEQVEFLGCVGGGREVLRHIRKLRDIFASLLCRGTPSFSV